MATNAQVKAENRRKRIVEELAFIRENERNYRATKREMTKIKSRLFPKRRAVINT